MSVKNFRFVSPGVFVDEIDNSQLPASPAGIGPVIIGRAAKGPGLRPVSVNSFEDFVNVFGAPSPGRGGSDVWRTGANTTAPTYGAYAAQAYLKNSSPLTYVRLLGAEGEGSLSGEGNSGWTGTQAWGLVVFEALPWSGDFTTSGSNATGSFEGALAAIFYSTGSSPALLQMSGNIVAATGSTATTGIASSGSSVIVKDTGVPYEFNMLIKSYDGTNDLKTVFNFTNSDSKYIRKVFNTNPQKTNSAINTDTDNYWLGETFDRHMKANIPSTATTYAAIVPLTNASNGTAAGHRDPLQAAQSPLILGCDVLQRGTSTNSYNVELMPGLFTVHALEEPGSWTNKNLKVSIQSIKSSTNESTAYGSFSVVVRKLDDSDNVVKVVEQFDNCNLNPDSLDYVARKIGDRRREWVAAERRYRVEGQYDSRSDYIRVAMADDVESYAIDAATLPFGFRGIIKYLDDSTLTINESKGNWVSASSTIGGDYRYSASTAVGGFAGDENSNTSVFSISGSALTASVLNPAPEFRVSASAGNLASPTDAYFGMQTTRTAGGTTFDDSNVDLYMARGGLVTSMFGGPAANISERSTWFTLDDITGSGGFAYWVSGSHAAGTSLTCQSGAVSGVLGAGFDRFTVPLYGGFDGLDITEMNPFRNSLLNGISSISDQNSYQFNSIKRAMDSVSDPEVVEMNLASMPGLTHEGLTNHLLNICEDRADALAVIDLKGGFAPRADSTSISRNNTASALKTVINNLRDRALNSSYGCAFYPWVRSRDTIAGNMVWLPPSIAALGTFSSSQRKTQVWFAPAGFNRGGLTEGSAGIPVLDVSHQLRRKDRDDLYEANINPIAKFPAEGIVIFGQKTLQVTPSALDRINVRRLMIFVKKRISQMSSRLLFDPNVQITWDRFIGMVKPFLGEVQGNFGLSDFRVVLDETTTTPELVDRNILYAQIFLKPTRAIEFIAIDFNISRTGASFDD
jgi:hypothetical protein